MDKFEYNPLNPDSSEIRLLILEPGEWDSPINCRLEHEFLDTNPRYEALSYTWGDASNLREIHLHAVSFNVTANLESALRHLRLQDESRLMWIDTLCTDQRNLEERSQQVLKMQQIYLQATAVVSW